MILDEFNEFADDVSVAAAAGTALIGDVIDLGSTTSDIGNGEPLYLVLKTGSTEIITGGAAGTIQFFLCSDSLATLGGGVVANCTTHLTSSSIVTDGTDANGAECKAGAAIIVAALPQGTYERYLGILCTIGTTTVTAGTANAFLTKDPAKWLALPDAI